MHGTIVRDTDVWDNFVITEEDYVEFLSRMTAKTAIPSLFYPYFRERSFLFLGYSLRDWNLRVVLKNLSKFFTARSNKDIYGDDEPLPSWSIQYKVSELEMGLWQARNVKIFDTTLELFTENMLKKKAQA
jgi:hypothetical protein